MAESSGASHYATHLQRLQEEQNAINFHRRKISQQEPDYSNTLSFAQYREQKNGS